MREIHLGTPACFYSPLGLAAFEFIDDEMRNFNPYRVQLTARELFAAAKQRFGLAAVDGLEFWIH